MKKPMFYEAGAFQYEAIGQEGIRNSTSKHTGQKCPCRCKTQGVVKAAVRNIVGVDKKRTL